MPLRIGITARLLHDPPPGLGLPLKRLQFLESSMAHWIMAHRAIALMIPFVDESAHLSPSRVPVADIVNLLDGLVLQGGVDISPQTYGGEALRPEWTGDPIRDSYELGLLRAFIEAGKPVLGVCRGAQLINVFYGGSLVQDIPSQWPAAVSTRTPSTTTVWCTTSPFCPGRSWPAGTAAVAGTGSPASTTSVSTVSATGWWSKRVRPPTA
jgi:putative glutamine amidotransferase